MIIYISKDNSNLLTEFEQKGIDILKFNGVTDLKKFVIQETQNLNTYKHIIIDLVGLADSEDNIIDAIVAIKRMYNIRITIVALGYTCNTKILNRLFNEGVYNFVTASNYDKQMEEIEQCISGDGMQYKDAIKYRANIDNIKGEKIVIRKEYSKLKQYVNIGVVGTQSRIGTTTQALLITKMLKDMGFNVCYIEANDHNHISKISELYEVKEKDGYIEFSNIDLYQDNNKALGYDFYVSDYGVLNDNNYELLKSRDLQIVVSGTKVWEQEYLLNTFDKTEKLANVHYIFTFAPQAEQKDISKNMGKLKLKTYFATYTPNPFEVKDEEIYHKILKDYIAEKTNKFEIIPAKENIFTKMFRRNKT